MCSKFYSFLYEPISKDHSWKLRKIVFHSKTLTKTKCLSNRSTNYSLNWQFNWFRVISPNIGSIPSSHDSFVIELSSSLFHCWVRLLSSFFISLCKRLHLMIKARCFSQLFSHQTMIQLFSSKIANYYLIFPNVLVTRFQLLSKLSAFAGTISIKHEIR